MGKKSEKLVFKMINVYILLDKSKIVSWFFSIEKIIGNNGTKITAAENKVKISKIEYFIRIPKLFHVVDQVL